MWKEMLLLRSLQPNAKRALQFMVLGLLAVSLAGCAPADSALQETDNELQQRGEGAVPVEHPEPISSENDAPPPLPRDNAEDGSAKLVAEYWERHSLRDSRIGYAHYVIEEVSATDQPDIRQLIRTTSQAESVVERIGQPVTQEMLLRSWETLDGELVRFETEMTAGTDKTINRGHVDPNRGQLVIEVQSTGKTTTSTIPWKPEYRGFFGVEQSLRDKPMEPGEDRSIFTLLPIINFVAENRLHATTKEAVSLPDGAEQLLKVDGQTIISLGGQSQTISTTLWVNDQGEALKSYIAGLQQETVRATRELALKKETGKPAMDLIEESVVKVSPPLENPLQTKRVLYRATVKEGSLAGVFPEGLSQRVKMINEQTAEVEVLAVNLQTDLPTNLESLPPAPADSAANNLIQSDDPRIGRLAMVPRRPAEDVFGIARDLESIVHKSIVKKNFSKAFASAAEVVRTMEGDCTEHSVLLAATCRARKIPTRVAIGLVYYPPQQGFAYHMWNEVWTGDRWLPLDATLGKGGIAADHIKLADSSLEGANAYSALLPVVQVFGRLQLEVLEVE